MANERTEFGFKRIVCDCSACGRFCLAMPGHLVPSDIKRIAERLNEPDIARFAFDNLLASPGAIVIANGDYKTIPTLVPARKPDGSCRFLCDLKQKMASGGSKRWRASYLESTTYEMLPRPGWKHQMAASRKWKQNVAGSRKILKRAIKSPIQRKIPRNHLRALRSFITNSNPN